jgi:hypothetical protein
MALVERLMDLETPRIPVHDFFAAGQEVIEGRLTVAQVKTFLAMDAAAQLEMDVLVATAPTGSSAAATANKAIWLGKIHAVFILAESRRYPGYDTAAAVRLKLGI